MDYYKQKTDLYFELKGLPQSTTESYSIRLQVFLDRMKEVNRPIEDITEEDIQGFILYLKRDRGLSAGTINNYISAIKYFYTFVLEKEWNSKRVPRMKRVKTLPVVPSKEEVMALLGATDNLKHKAILAMIYGSGLRVGEVSRLRIQDICSKSMRVRVEHAKHNTTRYTILSESSLHILRAYFRSHFSNTSYTPSDWLFPGQNHEKPINVKTIKNTVIKLRNKLNLHSQISAHTLRHCFSTHALEEGVDPVFIQQMLGHKSLQTTLAYLHMTSKSLMGVTSPLDNQKRQKR